MDWEQLREKTLGEVGTTLVAEGAGVTGGFLAAGFIGRQIQDRIKSDDAIVSTTDKLVAWSANNVPKIAMWYLLRRYATVEPGETLTPMKEATVDAKKAVAGSIIFDTLVRLSSGGKNPASVTLFGYRLLSGSLEAQKSTSSQADIQRLIQENSALRAELNKALQRLAQPPPMPAPVSTPVAQPAPQVAAPPPVQAAPVVQVQPPQVFQQAPPVIRYQPVTPPVVSYTPAPQPVPVQRVAPQPAPVQRVAPQPVPVQVPVQRVAPIVQVEQRPPMVRAQEVTQHIPVTVQPTPPAVEERERRYGFMNFEQSPPVVQEREKKYGFMKGGEKEIASMFGML
jgi:hypothetical protein